MARFTKDKRPGEAQLKGIKKDKTLRIRYYESVIMSPAGMKDNTQQKKKKKH
jgi:hypothetical protein